MTIRFLVVFLVYKRLYKGIYKNSENRYIYNCAQIKIDAVYINIIRYALNRYPSGYPS